MNSRKPHETSFRMKDEMFEEEYADNISDVPSDVGDNESSDNDGGDNIERWEEEDSFPRPRRNRRVQISSSSDEEESDEDSLPPPRKNRRVLRIPSSSDEEKKEENPFLPPRRNLRRLRTPSSSDEEENVEDTID